MPVFLSGVSQLQRNLRRFQPEAAKALKKRVGAELKPVTMKARGFVPSAAPLGGWAPRSFTEGRFPFFSSSTIKDGIGYTTGGTAFNRQGFSYVASIYNATRIGAIAETAGRKNPSGQPWVGPKGAAGHRYSHSNNPNAGKQFISALGHVDTGKAAGRYIFRAFEDSQGRLTAAVVKAYEDAAIKFYGKGLHE